MRSLSHPGPWADAVAVFIGVTIAVATGLRFGWAGALIAGACGLGLAGVVLVAHRIRFGRWTP